MCLRRSRQARCSPWCSASNSACRLMMPVSSPKAGGAEAARRAGGQTVQQTATADLNTTPDDDAVAAGGFHHRRGIRGLKIPPLPSTGIPVCARCCFSAAICSRSAVPE